MVALSAVLLLATLYVGKPFFCHAARGRQHVTSTSASSGGSDFYHQAEVQSAEPSRRRRMDESELLEEPASFTSVSEIISWTLRSRNQPSIPHYFKLPGEKFVFRAYEVSPFLERAPGDNGQLNFTGFSADLLKLIADEAEFSYSFAAPNSTRPGRLGPIMDVSAGIADATIGPIVPYSTSQKVAFTASYLDTGLVLVTYEGTADGDPLLDPKNMIIWMQPFTWSVWGTIVAIICVYAVIMFYLERDDTASVDFDAPEEQGARGLFKSFWLSCATFIGQLTGHVPGSVMGRLFMQTTAFVAVIIASSYTANLATFLTASRNAALASKLTSIHDAQAAASKICVGSLSTAPGVLSSSYNRIQRVQIVANTTRLENELGIDYLKEKRCAGMVMDQVDAYEIKAEMSDPCLLRIQGPVFLSQSYAIAVRRVGKSNGNFTRLRNLQRTLNYYLTKKRIDGSMGSIFKIDTSSETACASAAADANKISATQVQGPLVVFLVIAGIALLGKAVQLLTGKKLFTRGIAPDAKPA